MDATTEEAERTERAVRGHAVPSGRFVAACHVREVPDPGAGRTPIVLLHGLGATAGLNWVAAFERLGADRRVVAPDLPGHGRTPLRGRFRLSAAADAVAAVLDELGTGPAIVAGYSMGGAVAQVLAHRHPQHVAGLVLGATARDFRGRPADRLRFGACTLLAVGTRVVPVTPVSLLASVADGRAGDRWWAMSELGRTSPAAVCSAADALGRFTSRSWIGEVDVPATVLLTTRDRLVPPSRQAKLAHALPSSRLVPVDGDHFLPGRDPERFAESVAAAVDELDGRVRLGEASRAA
jgi:pimeloyl-ACP methyl ester carboxylesterase